MTDLKVVPLKQEGYKDPIAALKQIIADLESGDMEPLAMAVLVTMSDSQAVDSFAFGRKADDVVTALGLLRVGEQVILDSMIPAED